MIDDLRDAGLLDDDAVARFWRSGHFVYESGDHGDAWLALDLLFADPRRLRDAAARLAERLRRYAAEVVCGPLAGGALVGQWVAHALDAAFIVAVPSRTEPRPRTSYSLPEALRPRLWGRRVAVVDDAINAGAATRACARAIEAEGGRVVAVAALVVRVGGDHDLAAELAVPVEYLAGVRWNVWPPSDCPLCRDGVPIERWA